MNDLNVVRLIPQMADPPLATSAEAGPAVNQTASRPAFRFSFKRWLREPLLHFLLLGAMLFVIYGLINERAGAMQPTQEIALTPSDVRQLDSLFQAQWRRPPTPEEFGIMVENRIQEEVLYREAMALDLARDDTVVKRRMAQKMQFLAEDMAAAREPTMAQLKAWFDQHRDEFALPGRVSFRLLYFSPDLRGQRAQADAAKALARLSAESGNSRLAASLADPFMLQDAYSDRTPEQLAREFGSPFASAIFKLKPGSWQGPVESGFGWHLVWVDSVIPGRTPAFEEAEADVKTAWLAEQKAQAWRATYGAMRAKYTVRLPAPGITGPARP
jgi:hypothetical protein